MVEYTGIARNLFLAQMVDKNNNSVFVPMAEIKIGLREKLINQEYREETISFTIPAGECLHIARYFFDIHKECVEFLVEEKEGESKNETGKGRGKRIK